MDIGWIGTGVMGRSMAGHLINAGHRLTIYNRSRDKALPLVEQDATLVDTPAAVSERCDIVFTMVGYPSDVKQVILGDANLPGVLQGFRQRQVDQPLVIDMTTSMPSLAVEIHGELSQHRIASLDAPVSEVTLVPRMQRFRSWSADQTLNFNEPFRCFSTWARPSSIKALRAAASIRRWSIKRWLHRA